MKKNLVIFSVLLIAVGLIFGACTTTGGAAMAKAEWNVYDGSVLPTDASPAYVEDNTKGAKGTGEIIADADIAGNKLLKFTSPDGKDNKLCYAAAWEYDATVGATIVFRAKLLGDADKAMAYDFEYRNGTFRDRMIAFGNGTLKLDKAKVSTTVDTKEWHIVRIVLSDEAGKLKTDIYIDEDATPVLSGVSESSTSDQKFRFADGSGNDYASSAYDWVIWTTTGAFAPGTVELPGSLTGL